MAYAVGIFFSVIAQKAGAKELHAIAGGLVKQNALGLRDECAEAGGQRRNVGGESNERGIENQFFVFGVGKRFQLAQGIGKCTVSQRRFQRA